MRKTLVILAAGTSSRFGRLKQIETVGPNNEVLSDYSIYDAYKYGFKRVVFVIQKENLAYFQKLTKKYQDKIEVVFAFQSLDAFQDKIPASREKMLGTAHALYCAKDDVDSGFVMINADDFYGDNSFKIASLFLEKSKDPYEYLSVSFPFINSTNNTGKVNRGLIKEENGEIIDISECSIESRKSEIFATDLSDGKSFKISPMAQVSMNFFVFKPTIFNLLAQDLEEFLKKGVDDNQELILTDTIKKNIKKHLIKIKITETSSHWLGMTYEKDLEIVKKTLNDLIKKGIYPKDLWR